jgi:glycine/D-amino acid oxidase-like deaminating enzyme
MTGTRTCDVVVVGGGVMGSSVAYHLLKTDPGLDVVVVERDPSYSQASSALSAGNARIQFSLRENIEISLHALEVFGRFDEAMSVEDERPDIRFRQEGNLFLHEPTGSDAALSALALQKRFGGEVELWSPEEIRAHFPILVTEGLGGGTFGPRDGHLDGYALLMGYKAKAVSLGAEFLAAEVSKIVTGRGRAQGVQLESGEDLRALAVVNCAGAWAGRLAATTGVELPVIPVKRQAFVVETPERFDRPLPLTVLPTGLYFRSEAPELLLVGKSCEDDPEGYSFSWQESRFTDFLWPELAQWAPTFDRLRLSRGWAGLYAVNTLDGNAILGEWPELEGLFLANGFSGHGLQQAPAVGRYLAELVLRQEPTLDLSALGTDRIVAGEPLAEGGLV